MLKLRHTKLGNGGGHAKESLTFMRKSPKQTSAITQLVRFLCVQTWQATRKNYQLGYVSPWFVFWYNDGVLAFEFFQRHKQPKSLHQDSSFTSSNSNGRLSVYTSLKIWSRLSVPSMLVDTCFWWLWFMAEIGAERCIPTPALHSWTRPSNRLRIPQTATMSTSRS